MNKSDAIQNIQDHINFGKNRIMFIVLIEPIVECAFSQKF
jgi:hypothetical protein